MKRFRVLASINGGIANDQQSLRQVGLTPSITNIKLGLRRQVGGSTLYW